MTKPRKTTNTFRPSVLTLTVRDVTLPALNWSKIKGVTSYQTIRNRLAKRKKGQFMTDAEVLFGVGGEFTSDAELAVQMARAVAKGHLDAKMLIKPELAPSKLSAPSVSALIVEELLSAMRPIIVEIVEKHIKTGKRGRPKAAPFHPVPAKPIPCHAQVPASIPAQSPIPAPTPQQESPRPEVLRMALDPVPQPIDLSSYPSILNMPRPGSDQEPDIQVNMAAITRPSVYLPVLRHRGPFDFNVNKEPLDDFLSEQENETLYSSPVWLWTQNHLAIHKDKAEWPFPWFRKSPLSALDVFCQCDADLYNLQLSPPKWRVQHALECSGIKPLLTDLQTVLARNIGTFRSFNNHVELFHLSSMFNQAVTHYQAEHWLENEAIAKAITLRLSSLLEAEKMSIRDFLRFGQGSLMETYGNELPGGLLEFFDAITEGTPLPKYQNQLNHETGSVNIYLCDTDKGKLYAPYITNYGRNIAHWEGLQGGSIFELPVEEILQDVKRYPVHVYFDKKSKEPDFSIISKP